MKEKLLTGLLGVVLLLGCEKSKVTPAIYGDVHVVGQENDPATNKAYARYWKNGVGTNLSDGTQQAVAVAITMENDDVYIAGYEVNSSSNFIAKYWKNGTPYILNDASTSFMPFSIAVANSDVYVVGHEYGSGYQLAKYWKNGIAHNLSTGSTWASAVSISIDGADVYIAGYELTSAGVIVAKYWKNDVSITLSDGSRTTYASAISVKNSNVAVVGDELNSLNQNTVRLWNNSKSDVVSDSLHSVTLGNNMVQSGGNIYFVGALNSGPSRILQAYYWKNSTPHVLTDGTSYAGATSISMLGNDIYVAGYSAYESTFVAAYWKNGEQINLSTKQSFAYGIFVKQTQ